MDLVGLGMTKEVKGIALDIGCGTGLSSEPMVGRGFPTIGIDASLSMLVEGMKHGSSRMIDGVLADMGKPLPFRSDVFHSMTSVAAVHYLTVVSSVGELPESRLNCLFTELKRTNIAQTICLHFCPLKG